MSLSGPLIKLGVITSEVLSDATLASTQRTVNHNQFDETITPSPATIFSGNVYALVTGALTLDLRVLHTVAGGTGDGNGLKVQGFFFKNLGANTMTVTTGGTNGYTLLGASGLAVVQPGGSVAAFHNDASADVSGTVKTIDVTGTGTQTFEFAVILG